MYIRDLHFFFQKLNLVFEEKSIHFHPLKVESSIAGNLYHSRNKISWPRSMSSILDPSSPPSSFLNPALGLQPETFK